MRSKLWLLMGSALLLASAQAGAEPPLSGKALDAAFDAGILASDQKAWLKRLSAAPNHVGAPHNRENAEYMRDLYRSWGWDARIEEYQILYPTPISTTVELVAPQHIALGGQEPAIPEDSTSGDKTALPPYVAYQGDGDVTAEVVYVNYGMPADYVELDRRGIDVKGKIVLVRYGEGWRGLKPKLAQEHGAAGCIIYSDPADDGYAKAAPYPEGPGRPARSVQRGSVLDLPVRPGDPLTPDVGATRDAKRLTRETAENVLRIPVLPMSYADAAEILSRIGGRPVPVGWQGALPFAYTIGGEGGPVRLHLAVKSDWSLKPLYNVIATLKGALYPDEWIIRGNHRDGWVMGASDPLGGTIAQMAEAKAMGALLKRGWRPARTIVHASWDGEEPGLLGSTEWAEDHAAELKKKAVVYINTDGGGAGILSPGGSHSLQKIVTDAAARVIDPEVKTPLDQRVRARTLTADFSGERKAPAYVREAAEKNASLPLSALGSGSDYTPFLQHLGIASLNLGFSPIDGLGGGVYHSIYDSYDYSVRFIDPDFSYKVALAQVVGRITLDMAGAPTPAWSFGEFADTIGRYLDEVKTLDRDQRDKAARAARLASTDAFRLGSDPKAGLKPPPVPPAPPSLSFAPMETAVARLKASAGAYDAAYRKADPGLPVQKRAQLNMLLRDIDQLLLDPRGLPGRPWFMNLVYAPGLLTGYGVKTLPGLREAIEENRFQDIAIYMNRTASVLNSYSDRLDRATALLSTG